MIIWWWTILIGNIEAMAVATMRESLVTVTRDSRVKEHISSRSRNLQANPSSQQRYRRQWRRCSRYIYRAVINYYYYWLTRPYILPPTGRWDDICSRPTKVYDRTWFMVVYSVHTFGSTFLLLCFFAPSPSTICTAVTVLCATIQHIRETPNCILWYSTDDPDGRESRVYP